MPCLELVCKFENCLINKELNYDIYAFKNFVKLNTNYLNNEQQAIFIKQKFISAVASLGIATLLLDRNHTAHSQFKIPIELHEDFICNIFVYSNFAELLKQATFIIWNKAPIMHHHSFEAVNCSHEDIVSASLCSSYLWHILAPCNSKVDILNTKILSQFSEETKIYFSTNALNQGSAIYNPTYEDMYLTKFLNSLML
ncbi:ATP-dependent DNA helicase PIF1-like [Gigaspora margarita]|uniref:ATP-dependent DNA helicase n=1 Tax=Gigaspora margarita TaxID=4874 RepID=A0A8H4AMZ6_GIGMA|nr:ATP-dependent DNA helicase PIF1-like [Gigaspora margarita]